MILLALAIEDVKPGPLVASLANEAVFSRPRILYLPESIIRRADWAVDTANGLLGVERRAACPGSSQQDVCVFCSCFSKLDCGDRAGRTWGANLWRSRMVTGDELTKVLPDDVFAGPCVVLSISGAVTASEEGPGTRTCGRHRRDDHEQQV